MAMHYGYQYAIVVPTNGLCREMQDTTDYILDHTFVPIDNAYGQYLLKYYWPLPSSPVTSFDDFQGKWYTDAEHQNEWIPT